MSTQRKRGNGSIHCSTFWRVKVDIAPSFCWRRCSTKVIYSHHGKHDPLSHFHQPYCDAYDLFRILEHGGDDNAACSAIERDAAFAAEPKPLDDIKPATPTFPMDILPPVLRAYVESVAEHERLRSRINFIISIVLQNPLHEGKGISTVMTYPGVGTCKVSPEALQK